MWVACKMLGDMFSPVWMQMSQAMLCWIIAVECLASCVIWYIHTHNIYTYTYNKIFKLCEAVHKKIQEVPLHTDKILY